MTIYLNAKIWKLIYRNPRNFYTIMQAIVEDKMETLVGYFPIVNEGLVINCHGKREIGKRKTPQYKIESYSIELPETPFNLNRFLMNDFFSATKEVADIIETQIGVAYLENYQDATFLKEKIGATSYSKHTKEFTRLRNRLNDIKTKLKVMDTMIQMGFNNDVSSKVSFSDYKTSPEKIKSNPYELMTPFDIEWNTVDGIALKNNINLDSSLRIQEAICYLLDDAAQNQSHVYINKKELFPKLKSLLRTNILESTLDKELTTLELNTRVVTDFENRVYGVRYYHAEEQLSKDLYRIFYSPQEEESLVKEMMEYVKSDVFTYSDEQLLAIERALLYPLSIINGPAGTGKTTVLAKIIECIEIMEKRKRKEDEAPYDIKICAPTGQAAERAKEVTGKQAQTIHSLLGHHPLTKLPAYNEFLPLSHNCFIIEEASMIDVVLKAELLNAIPKGAKVVIVGDVDQLPSIGPGNVLHELIFESEFPKTELTSVYRQGAESKILELATSIRTGDTDIQQTLFEKSDDLNFISTSNLQDIEKHIVHICKLLINNPNFDFIKDAQIITPIHKSLIGTINLNKAIQSLLNEKKERKKLTMGDKTFYVGDKVMHLVNNKEKDIFNGEKGQIISIIGKTIHASFSEGKVIEYTGEEIFELELAFASTVHKMQGSESKVIIIPMHTSFYRMLQRNLLYTGVTRAKLKLLLLGELEAIIKSIRNDYVVERNSSLKERLVEARLSEMLH